VTPRRCSILIEAWPLMPQLGLKSEPYSGNWEPGEGAGWLLP
jgi:hypothetical protein